MATKFQLGVKFLMVLYIGLVHCCCILRRGEAATANLIDPQEVEALKSIAKKLRHSKWNFSLDPCSGEGGWNVSIVKGYENLVDCNCTLDGENSCHVTRLLLKRQNLSGVVPPELSNLTYLEELDLTRNYLNGPLPAELGSLIYLKSLAIGINRLSGHIPEEFGNLNSLTSLVVLSNNLSGELPRQLAKLSKLKRLHIGNNHFSGRIPRQFSLLKRLDDFRAGSNNFVGRIPNFIGNWKKLSVLRLEATFLKGPIPWTISGLTELQDLRISDLIRGRSNLSFVHNLTNLKTLVLRNALIYGEIPSSIGYFKKLEILDLGFNRLTGSIPDTFNTLTRKNHDMEYLYLGNNSLAGSLPPWLTKINHVDLSYNNFSGDFPSDLTGNSKLNLIGNSFKTTNLTIGRGEAYLQRNFICDKGHKRYISLAINCGGEAWKTFDPPISYEADQNPVGASSFYFNTEKKNWAVSSTGHFLDNSDQISYVKTVDNSLSPLYRTARVSPTSLRYYGLCLRNGQYTVQLHFAEIVFANDNSFSSLGRRIFDVYIQGRRILRNFNIQEVAGGADKVVVKNFTTSVTKNFLEVHFFWAGNGTYNVPEEGTYGPLVSAIVVTPDFEINGRNRTSVIIGIVFAVVISLVLAVSLSFMFVKNRNGIKNRHMEADVDRGELTNMKTNFNSFSLEEIRSATGDFHPENKLGEGGFGAVFKGVLPDGKMLAVKQMISKSKQGSREFLNEVGTISALQHPNLVKLYGCCAEGKQLLLVYEYLENNNLARALFGPQEFRLSLNWPARYNICLGVAHGLAYLHGESRLRIVHRDIKSTNILLDKDLNPKISDFGLAKLFDQEKTHVSTRVAGTIGYMAPEYALKGQLTEKADVYSFGVVILEVVSGRAHTEKKLQEEKIYLLEWAWHLYKDNRLLDLVDMNLKNSTFSEEQILRTINVGLLCTCATPKLRPSMSKVVELLEGKIEVHVSNCQPQYLGYEECHVLTEEGQSSCSRSLSLEGPWKRSFSSQANPAAKQQRKAKDNDNDEISLISHQVHSDLYPFSIHDHP